MTIVKALRRFNCRQVNFIRKFSWSALYVTGDKAQTNFVPLTPYLDFDEQLKNKADLESSIVARKLPIDLDKVEKRWYFYNMINDHKIVLEITRTEVQGLLKELKIDSEKNRDQIEKVEMHMKIIRDDLKNVKEYLYGVEENAALSVLSLPNFLHKNTPRDYEIIYHQFGAKAQPIDKCHMTLGVSQELIECVDRLSCFLKSEAALFEFALSNYLQKTLLEMEYIQFSNADFARSIIVEGCGSNYLDSNSVFTIDSPSNSEINKLHLVGGGTLYSFMAYFAKHLIQPGYLPLKTFSIGRTYTPRSAPTLDLFNIGQNTVARVFIAVEDNDDKMESTFQNVIKNTVSLYEPLNYHFRLVYLPAHKLEPAESLRMSIQMYSNYLQKYIEVGNISSFDSYLSKRLLFSSFVNKESKFLRVISGEILNIHKVLGCVLENNSPKNSPLLSSLLQEYIY